MRIYRQIDKLLFHKKDRGSGPPTDFLPLHWLRQQPAMQSITTNGAINATDLAQRKSLTVTKK
ncbi:MAG TPA: hypothetical protein DCZ95_10490 [Verrucomicrobia bacterium]|nr:hypothetical protein [Verrucomicrobiota bacterium]